MRKRLSCFGIASAALVLSACGGGPASRSVPASALNGPATAQFSITVPKASAQSPAASRKPLYISPNAQSASIAVGALTPVVVNLTPSSPGCSTGSGGTTCTVEVTAPIGSDTFTVQLFSQANAAGSLLAAGSVTQAIVAGPNNSVNVTLNGVVASVAIALANPSPAVGMAATIPVTVTAKDSTGATILGAGNYSPAITLTDSDTSGHTKLSTTTVASPGTSVTLSYDGSSAVTSATISATLNGTIATVAPAQLTPKGVITQNGSGGVGVLSLDGNTYAEVPTAGGLLQVQIGQGGTLLASPSPAPSPLALNPAPDACAIAPNGANISAYCIAFALTPAVINVVDLTTGTPTFVKSISTDASSEMSFSGGQCYICGVAWDPVDGAVVIATANGYEFYDPSTGSQTRPTIAAPISENFAYDAATDQIWSPQYQNGESLDVIDVASGSRYTLSLPSGFPALGDPDGGAVDPSTGVAFSTDEGGVTDYIVPLSGAVLSTPSPAPGQAGTFTDPLADATTTSQDSGCETTAFAIDSVSHIAFLSGEFSSPDCFGAIALPPAAPTSPVTPTAYMWIQAMPDTPDGNPFDSPYDPHVAATFYLGAGSDLYGLLFNYERSYLAVVDITKLLQAPGSSTDPHVVDPLYNLFTNEILTYIPTGSSLGPASIGRRPER